MSDFQAMPPLLSQQTGRYKLVVLERDAEKVLARRLLLDNSLNYFLAAAIRGPS
jgi:hypothetical protein